MSDLIGDPRGWARKSAGTRRRMGFAMLAHIVYCTVLCYLALPEMPNHLLLAVFFIGAAIPSMYLYALHGILNEE